MESWLPWLTDADSAAHRRAAAHRQGGAGRAAPDARPGRGPARRRGRPRPRPRQHVGPRPRCRVPTPARRARPAARRRCRRVADDGVAGEPRLADRELRAAGGRSSATARGSPTASSSCSPTSTASSSPPTARARRNGSPSCCANAGLDFAIVGRDDGEYPTVAGPAARVVVAPLHRGCIVPSAKVAIVAEGDLTGRRRTHRQPRARKRQSAGFFEDLQARQLRRPPPARRRPVRGDGEAHDRRRRARLPAARLQGRRQALHPQRSDRHDPPVRRRRGAGAAPPRRGRLRQGQVEGQVGGARDRPGARRALPEADQRDRATRSVSTRRGSTTWRRRSRSSRRPTRRQAIDDTKSDMERDVPDGPAGLRRRRLRQDRGRRARRVQGDPGRQAGRRARADDAARHAARQHVRRPVLRLPDPGRSAQPLPHQRPGEEGHRRARDRRGRLRDRHPPAAAGRASSSRTSAC